MSNVVPLFCFPTTWAVVDDDKKLLHSMKIILKDHAHVKLFNTTQACLDFFSSYKSVLSEYAFLKSVKDNESYGVLEHTPLDCNVKMFIEIANNQCRCNEVSVLMVDYHMPEMTGYELAKKIDPAIQKILLTGAAQDKTVIEGFNHKLIDRFVQKGNTSTEEMLMTYLEELTLQYFQKMSLPMLLCLEAENKLPQSDPVFIHFFNDFCVRNNVKEYYLIDKQGSFLCRDEAGNQFCLAIQTDQSIDALVSNYLTEILTAPQLNDISLRRIMPFCGVGVEPWHIEPSHWSRHLYDATHLKGREHYYWAVVKV